MTKEEKEAVLHCLRSMIDEELCEECPLYGTTGTDHCEKDCVRLAIEALEQEPCEDATLKEIFCMGCEYKEQKPCEDAISRREAISIAGIATLSVNQVVTALKKLPPVNPQKPICPIKNGTPLKAIEQKPKSEWQQDHEILKAYSDGASAVLDKVRLDIAQEIITKDSDEYDYEAKWQNMGLRIALKVIDKYKAEGSNEWR